MYPMGWWCPLCDQLILVMEHCHSVGGILWVLENCELPPFFSIFVFTDLCQGMWERGGRLLAPLFCLKLPSHLYLVLPQWGDTFLEGNSFCPLTLQAIVLGLQPYSSPATTLSRAMVDTYLHLQHICSFLLPRVFPACSSMPVFRHLNVWIFQACLCVEQGSFLEL